MSLTPDSPLGGMALVVCGTVAFAVTVVLAPFVYASGSDPLTFVWWRSLVVSALLALFLVLRGKSIQVPARDRIICIGIGVLMTAQILAFFTAISLIPVSIGTLIEYTYPFQVAIAARVLYRETLPWTHVLLILGALVGLMLVIEIAVPRADLNPFGVGLMIGASLLLTAKTMTTYRVLQRVDAQRTTLYLCTTVAVVCTVVYWLTPLEPAWPGTPLGWGLLAIMPLCSVAGMLCFYTGLARIGPGRASMLSNCEPIFILLLALVLLGERFTVLQSIGALVVLVCIVWFQVSTLKSSS